MLDMLRRFSLSMDADPRLLLFLAMIIDFLK